MQKQRALFVLIFLISFVKSFALSPAEPLFERTLLFDMGDEGSRFYRIPTLVTAADGSLVVVADKRWDKINDLPSHIDVIARRSEDNGKTWSKPIIIAGRDTTLGFGDATVVLDRKSGNLVCIFASGNGLWHSNKDNLMRINVSKSADNGKTWSEPRDITSQIYGKGCPDPARAAWFGAFAASGRALQLKDGRIMFAIAARLTSDWGGRLSNYACYSDDGGDTWSVSKNAAEPNGDEAKLIELNNGDVLMSIRNRDKGTRKFCISKDRGVTWGSSFLHPDIQEPACNGDIIRYSSVKEGAAKNRILHSIPYDPAVRRNVSVLISYDEGKTWPVRKTISPALSAYSSMTVLPDGTIGIVVEEGKWDADLPGEDGFKLWFMRFSLDWLEASDKTL